MKKVRYAVVGLGHIAQTAALPGLKNARRNSQLTALVSDDPVKLKKLSKQYKVPSTYSHDEFEACLKSGLVDAVYIATPNTHHRRFAEIAVEHGVHVLCEKPLAASSADCEAMIAAARRHKVKLMTAYRLHFDAANLRASQLAHSGKLGELRYFNSIFSYQITDEDNIRLQKDKAGGPLYDIGIYCLNAARSLFRAEPTEVFAFSTRKKGDSRFSEVEEMVSAVMKFPDERLASFTCSFGSAPRSRYDLVGTKGSLQLDNSYEYAESMKMDVVINEKSKKSSYAKKDQFGPEFAYFSDCILKNREPEPSGTEGLADLRVIEALFTSMKEGRAVKVSAAKKGKYPHPRQKIRMPAVREPSKVHVTSPSS
ncbi:MAG: Gfo/Idh/MocA family oxidoreductase [Bdellovibrionaceae bacterium]|nr:Gfo/Idh/MocA family oxidoreductase [Pseudobdellovibrionaceae bacterium]